MTKIETQIPAVATEVLDWLQKQAPEALLLEPRDVYDPAIIGRTCEPNDHWVRKEQRWVAVYSATLCIAAIEKWMDCDFEEAMTWFDFNTSGAWCGEDTPTFHHDDEDCC
jgi:hypothetical protein